MLGGNNGMVNVGGTLTAALFLARWKRASIGASRAPINNTYKGVVESEQSLPAVMKRVCMPLRSLARHTFLPHDLCLPPKSASWLVTGRAAKVHYKVTPKANAWCEREQVSAILYYRMFTLASVDI